jgi:hypothetical protein
MRFLIKNHNKSTLDYIDSLGVNKDSLAPKPLKTMMAVKPPNPCPIGKTCLYSSTSISYYTINPEDSCNVYKNSSKIKVADTNYDKETSIKTFNYASPIKGNKGDRITVKYSVTYPTAQGTVSENGTYTEVVE